MILCDENVNYQFLEKIASKLSDKDIELIFTDDYKMKEINQAQRNINKSTDVLSFPLQEIQGLNLLGSVVINLDLAQKKAKELGHSLEDEISLLFIHGALHLMGFDHETDNGQMRTKESELIKLFNLPKSLIVRAGES